MPPTTNTSAAVQVTARPRRGRAARPGWQTAGELLADLGNIPAKRVRLQPPPGTATERDLLHANEGAFRTAICELVDGTLVEKPMGFEESAIAVVIASAINTFARRRKLGVVLGADGMLRLNPRIVRAPDVSFIARSSFPDGKRPTEPIPSIGPDLAVEVLSKSNTKAEMERRVREYFAAGSRLVWFIDPKRKTARVFTSPADSVVVAVNKSLDGGDVLPGFRLPLKRLFDLD